MASGSSGRAGTGAKGFDFGSDDILCSYEDYGGGINHDSSANGTHSGPSAATSAMDFHKSRMARSSVLPAISYAQPEDSFNQDVISTVEKSMKKHTENLMRFLEGISSRLSQLELYCYNLDKSIGEMRSDLVRDHGEADTKLKSLEKHIQEVHRSVQILRDKQELADAQKELTKLQLVQKDSSSSNHSYSSEEKASGPASDLKKSENASEMHNQQLALALPHQVLPQQQPPPPIPPPTQAPPTQNVGQQQSYYLPPTQLPTQPPQPQHHPQSQYIPPSDPQYRASQMQDISRISPQPTQIQPGQQFPPYQQQWPPQQLPPQVQPPQQPSVQPQMRPPSTTVYPPFQSAGQPTNQSPEMLSNNVPMQVSYSAVPQPLTSGADAVPYGYGAGRTVPQPPPPQQIKGGFGPQPGDGYATAGPHPALPPGSSYMMYDSEGGRTLHAPQQSHFPRGGYPPSNLPLQNAQPTAGGNMLGHNPSPSQYMRGHPYSELIDKLVSMGFRGDIVIGVIQRMEESGQPVDFNAVLDRLSAPSSGSSQRAWSG